MYHISSFLHASNINIYIIIITSISNIELEPKKKTADIYTYHSNYHQENKEKIKQQARERSKKAYDDEAYREQKKKKMRERAKIRLLNTEYLEKNKLKSRVRYNTDEIYLKKIRDKASQRLKNNPDIKVTNNKNKRYI
jgi:hypothetical protein